MSAHPMSYALLNAGAFYFAGNDSSRFPNDERLPLTSFQQGWHPTETWGCWASHREARLRFETPYAPGTEVLLVALIHAPRSSPEARCVIRIGGIESSPSRLTPRASWHFAHGKVSQSGVLDVSFCSAGQFSQPDARRLYVGVHCLAYCATTDVRMCSRLRRRARPSILRAYQAISGLLPSKTPSATPAMRRPQHYEVSRQAFSTGREERSANDALMAEVSEELMPRPIEDLLQAHQEQVELRQIGQRERTQWGSLRTLRGISAIRGSCTSRAEIREVMLLVDGEVIQVDAMSEAFDLKFEIYKNSIKKYVFNIWYDFSGWPQGRHEIEIRAVDINRRSLSHREIVSIAAPVSATDYPASDAVVSLPSRSSGSLETDVNALPSVIRTGRRDIFDRPPKNVLVVRADQLGDMVCSIPAIKRLRQLLPEARLVGLLSPANEDLARTLALFDEILVVDFRDDPDQRRRVMSADQQLALRAELKKYSFDLAIDMSDSGVSRPLLLLSGAPFLYGFRPGEFPWLSAAFEGVTRDFSNGLERVPHTDKVLGLVEWLGVILKSHSEVITRPDLGRAILERFGLREDDQYAVLHTGARIRFSRWPHYQKLAALLLERSNLKVVMMTDDTHERSTIDPALSASPRFQLIDRRLSFDEFDGLLSFCSVFVGNDSGPKHLASLRGA
jgi:ADP-heptose:LPS heptosyltransferase